MKDLAVLHVDPDFDWRGGQQQALYLHQGMLARGFKSCLVCNPGSQMEQRLKQETLDHIAIRHHFEADLWAAFRLALYAKRRNFNILHLHSSHALSWGLLAKLFHPSLQLVATRRVNVPIGKNLLSAFKYKGKMLNAVVAISQATLQQMLSDGIPKSKIRLIYSGIDLHKFDGDTVAQDFREHWQIPEDAILVGTVAAIEPPKDYPNLITAAALASAKDARLHFIVVGDGSLRNQVQEICKTKGLQKRVTFSGFQKQVGNFLKSFDIFVLASKREGLGSSVLDAMSVGLPVVGTRAGGIAEMIEDGVSGLLVEARNSEALAEAILKLAADKDLRDSLGHGALKRCRDFSKERMVEENIRLYQSLL